jgi:hypothetical protein
MPRKPWFRFGFVFVWICYPSVAPHFGDCSSLARHPVSFWVFAGFRTVFSPFQWRAIDFRSDSGKAWTQEESSMPPEHNSPQKWRCAKFLFFILLNKKRRTYCPILDFCPNTFPQKLFNPFDEQQLINFCVTSFPLWKIQKMFILGVWWAYLMFQTKEPHFTMF